MNPALRFLPHTVLALGVIYLIACMLPGVDRAGDFQYSQAGTIAIVDGGRIKPLDTVARVNMMIVSKRQTWTDNDGRSQPATRWLLDLFTLSEPLSNPAGTSDRVYRIDNDQLLGLLNLEVRSGRRYSLDEIWPRMPALMQKAQVADRKKREDRDAMDTQTLDLAQHIQQAAAFTNATKLILAPPLKSGAEWQRLGDALRDSVATKAANPPAEMVTNMLVTYSRNDAIGFNHAVAEYHGWMDENMPGQMRMLRFESFFNNFSPFYHCAILYLCAFLLSCFALMGQREQLNKAALWLLILTVVVHTWALGARMYLMDRPFVFVTNLYSSAIFIGWVAVVAGIILEAIYQNGIGNLVGSVIACLTMVIAHHLGGDADTLEMMQAVLDTNFWLATHVTTVTIGYAATFLAGILGLAFVVFGVFTRLLTADLFKGLTQMIYGIVCFATLFSFVGTVLGGIWADVSWGRFWGWDAKENGALIIVMWNALALHARWAGMVKQRGMALLAIFGNVVTAWSWFGVNMLDVGLHSYGPMSGAWWYLGGWWVFNLGMIGLGLLPTSMWQSFGTVVPPIPDRPAPMSRKPKGRRDAPQPAGVN